MKKKLTILTAFAVAASVLLATPSVHAAATLTSDEATIIAHLPNGVTIATATAEQIATATAAAITTAPKLPANRAITAAFSLTDAGAGPGVYNGDARDADVFILEAVGAAQVKSPGNTHFHRDGCFRRGPEYAQHHQAQRDQQYHRHYHG
ncbi:MAG: hypothetical protein QM796_02025, partial [Chthoniobacteraceae bacterium]